MKTWTDLAGAFAQAGLTGIGTALGGPLGGVIGGLLGTAAATALGVEPTPSAVQDVLERDPAGAAEKLKGVEAEALAHLEAEARIIADVNAAAREDGRGDRFQRSWRPLNGYVFALIVAGYGLAIVAAALRGVFGQDAAALNVLAALLNGVGNMTLFLTPSGAVVGVTAWTRGRENEARLTGVAPPSLAAQVTKAFGKGRPS